MAWRKKATWTWADILFWFVYIPMTAVAVVALVFYPEKIFAVSLQPMILDSSLMVERFQYQISDYDQFIGVREGFLTPGKPDEVLTLIPSEKRYAVKVLLGSDVWFPSKTQKMFYEDALPLTGVRYKKFDKDFIYKDSKGKLVKAYISQIFPQVYEKTRR